MDFLGWSLKPETPHWRNIVKSLTRDRRPIPDDLPPPPMMPAAMPFWRAFDALSSCRPVGMGIGPIPWTAIDAYATRFGLAGNDLVSRLDFDVFQRIINQLDSHWLEHVRKT